MITTSNRVVGSNVSTARASGMIQTGTAERHSVIFWLASTISARDALSHPLADAAHHVEPAHQRLLLLGGRSPHLRSPRAALDQLRRHLSQLADRAGRCCACSAGSEAFPRRSSSSCSWRHSQAAFASPGGVMRRAAPRRSGSPSPTPGATALQCGEKLTPGGGDLSLAIEGGEPLVGLAVLSHVQPLRSARQPRADRRRRPLLRERQPAPQLLELRVGRPEPHDVLARLESLRQLDARPSPSGAAAAPPASGRRRMRARGSRALSARSRSAATPRRARRGSDGPPSRTRQAASSGLSESDDHAGAPCGTIWRSHRPSRSLGQDRQLDLPAQRLELSGALRLAGGDAALADEPLPVSVRQQASSPTLLFFSR